MEHALFAFTFLIAVVVSVSDSSNSQKLQNKIVAIGDC